MTPAAEALALVDESRAEGTQTHHRGKYLDPPQGGGYKSAFFFLLENKMGSSVHQTMNCITFILQAKNLSFVCLFGSQKILEKTIDK